MGDPLQVAMAGPGSAAISQVVPRNSLGDAHDQPGLTVTPKLHTSSFNAHSASSVPAGGTSGELK